jgi:hypothetical protein
MASIITAASHEAESKVDLQENEYYHLAGSHEYYHALIQKKHSQR